MGRRRLPAERPAEADTDGQVTALANRIAAEAPLDNPWNVASLLYVLREVGAGPSATALADRAVHIPLDNLRALLSLLHALREAGADGQVTALADRIAADAP
jgi:hypothetical protein